MNHKFHGRTLLCRTKYQGIAIPGRISFSPEMVRVRLVGFEDFVHFRHGASVSLQLEDNRYCTVVVGTTSSGIAHTATDTCHSLKFDATQVIIGFRHWDETDRVKEFHFRLSDTNRLLDAPDIYRKIAAAKAGEDPETKIIEATSDGTTVILSYSYSLGWFDDTYSVDDFHGCVKFADSKSLGEVSDFVAILQTFFTMAAGVEVRTTDYWLIPDKGCEQSLLGGRTAHVPFQLMWPSGEPEQSSEPKGSHPTSVLRSFNESDRLDVSKCLAFWMDSWTDWKPAFYGLFLAARAGSVFDTNRIINACKWLDTTPGVKPLELEIEPELQEIITAATAKAADLGLEMSSRISGAIIKLKTESRNETLKRLIDRAVKKNDPQLKDRLRKDVHNAYEIRGRFAHSAFDHESNDKFDDYVRCTMAVECLAFLLLYRSLPLPADHYWGHGPSNFTEYLLPESASKKT